MKGMGLLKQFFNKWFSIKGTPVNEHISFLTSEKILDAHIAFEVKLTLPGFTKEDLKLEIQEDFLVVSSEKQLSTEGAPQSNSGFCRLYELPERVDPERVQVVFQDEILVVRFAYRPGYETKLRRVAAA